MTNPTRGANNGIMIPRLIENLVISSLVTKKKVHLLLGARQVGKTTLLKDMRTKLETMGKQVLFLNCDVLEDKNAINSTSRSVLKAVAGENDYVFVDEAQRLDDPGLTFKILFDEFPKIRVLATGSSSFELKNKSAESLAGRYIDFTLYPFSAREIDDPKSWNYNLPQFLTYGFYPEVYLASDPSTKREMLTKIVESYLFRDILSFNRVRNSELLINLTKALAYQIGSEVNENELATRLKADRKTVVSYIDILEKGLIISRLYPFSKNPRHEIGKNYKVYFVDLGIRNSLIDDFNPLDIRQDTGHIWENFLIMERKKKLANKLEAKNGYFWRTYGGAEVDYLEQKNGKIYPIEIKWGDGNLSVGARSFEEKYATKVSLVNKENYENFI